MFKNKHTIMFMVALAFSQPVFSVETNLLSAAYIDTMNKVNIKAGIAFNEPYEYSEEMPHYYGSFKYIDFELGLEGTKVSIGKGVQAGHGIDRIGISYAKFKTQDLAGIEAIISQMGMSIKLGYYAGLEDTDDKWLVGVGFGF